MSTSPDASPRATAPRPLEQASPRSTGFAARRWGHTLGLLAACLGLWLPSGSGSAQQEPSEGEGTLRVLVFYVDGPVGGATVKAAGQTGSTNRNGSVELTVPSGMLDVQVKFQAMDAIGSRIVSGSQKVGVVAGETTEVIVALEERQGELSWDVEGPTEEEVQTAEEVQKATDFGTIVGHIKSIEDSKPVADARVYVRGVDTESVTDAEGRFEVKVPVGTHAISVIHPNYSTLSRPDVEVKLDETTEIDVVMTPASVRLDDFIVTAPHIEGSVAGLMDERRASSSVSDAIGREDISKMPASDAAGAAQRVVGATIVGGRFVYVRGLGGRYSNALLNGGPLPSPEPDQATVPLDLFPAQIIESLDIVKTFTPDVPGDFAGGSVRIITRGVPEEPVYNVSLKLGYNSQSTLRRKWNDPPTSTDWLGFDNGRRAMPSAVPDAYPLNRGAEKPDGTQVDREEIAEVGRAVNSRMSPRRQRFGPDMSGSLLMGNGWEFGKGRKFGLLGSLVYNYGYDARAEIQRQYQPNSDLPGGLQRWTDYNIDYSNRSVRWGAFLTAIMELSEDHKLQTHFMHSQLADNTTRLGEGFQQNEMREYQTTRMQFASRGLSSSQVQGEHTFGELYDAEIEWRVWVSLAQRDQPDTRDTAWSVGTSQEGGDWVFADTASSGRHFFSNQSELVRGGAFDWTQPLWKGDFATKLKAGTMINAKARDFRSRRLTFRPTRGGEDPNNVQNCGPNYAIVRCNDTLFTENNIGPESVLSLEEGFRPGDAYDAILNVYAGYGMMEFQLGEHWRALGGLRAEKTQQELTAIDPFNDDEVLPEISASLNSLDLLPAGSLVYSPIEEVSIRAAASKTLARPQLRELAPFAFADYFGGWPVSGNPELTLTSIINADLRFEWYPTAREVLALSLFAKKFDAPIEPVIRPSGSQSVITYQNAESARLFGIELESRKSLDFIHETMDDFTIIGSLMLAMSKIELADSDDFFNTNTDRPLVNQAPYVINLALDYENESGTQFRVLYNVSGSQIVEVGSDGLDDAYLHPRHMLDATLSQRIGDHWRLKLTGQNLTNAEYLVTQGKEATEYNVRVKYREGVSVALGASMNY